MPIGDPNRLYKGRSVFQGNNVKDERYDAAVFQELGSSPATLSASKAADMYGLLPGHILKQADAEAAYINAKLNTEAETWVRLPEYRVPEKWKKMKLRDPVCRLDYALYGHPESGRHWDIFSHKMLVSEGWNLIQPPHGSQSIGTPSGK